MSSLSVVQPVDVAEAIELLSSALQPWDSPTQRRYRDPQHLAKILEHGRRRPEGVWAVRDGDRVLAAAGLLYEGPGVLDFMGGTDPEAVRAVARAATDALAPDSEALIFAPPGTEFDDALIRPWADALAASGWRPFVARRHYEFTPDPQLGRDIPLDVNLERLHDPHDPRLLAVHGEIMRDTLDAHDAELVRRLGLEAATRQSLADMLEADDVDCFRLALDGDRPVGYVSWLSTPSGRGFTLFVGVASSARGRGLGRQLLGAATRALIDDGATTLIADTDRGNVPMGKAFEAVGWRESEARLDYARGTD